MHYRIIDLIINIAIGYSTMLYSIIVTKSITIIVNNSEDSFEDSRSSDIKDYISFSAKPLHKFDT